MECLGCVIGPAIGSLLYLIGGLKFMFFSLAFVFILAGLFVRIIFLPEIDNIEVVQSDDRDDEYGEDKFEEDNGSNVKLNSKVSNIGLLTSSCRYTFACLAASYSYFLYSFMEPILAIRLEEYELS